MKFSIGYNHDAQLLDLLSSYQENIEALYFPAPVQYIGSGRITSPAHNYTQEIPNIIAKCTSLNITSQLLLNATCEGGVGLDKRYFERLVDYIKELRDMGLGSVVVTNPVYISKIRTHISDIRIESSVNCYVKTVEHAVYLKELGVDVLTIDRDINRNIPLIKQIKERTALKIRLMLNEGCLRNCPYRVMHYNNLSHHSSITDKVAEGIAADNPCTEIYERKKEKVFSVPFIPPEALNYYESFIDYYKLSTRVFPTNRIQLCLESYINREFNGNLLELLDSPGLVYFEYIDYKTLRDSDFFNAMIACDGNCSACRYCTMLAHKATVVNRDFSGQDRKQDELNAIRVYENILKTSSGSNREYIYELVSRACFNVGQYMDAIKYTRSFLELRNGAKGAHFFLGLCYEKMEEYTGAIKEYKKEEKINPDDACVALALARCYRNMGRTELSSIEIDKCIRKAKAHEVVQ
ncbi:MAG: U32 family peptidase [Candidatus Omnitrophica bacterium]|nr:U32 family peptidase [Candidatus Omnitrophota bacterium]